MYSTWSDYKVSIVIRLSAAGLGSLDSVPDRSSNFLLHHSVQADPWTAPASCATVIGLETKWPGLKADDSHASNAEVKNRESCTSTILFQGVG